MLGGAGFMIGATLTRRAFAFLPRAGQPAEVPKTLASTETFRRLEGKSGGRLGVFLLDMGTGAHVGYRAEERFPMCSTFKFLLAGAVLRRIDRGADKLDRVVRFGKQDLLSYAPLTTPHVDTGMTLADLCSAAVTMSDNTAANVLLREIGGPEEVTAFARSVGDSVTRLDRDEPTLNESTPGDPRDTTTPRAIAEDMGRLAAADTLSERSRMLLTEWLVGCKTGDKRIRAAVPAGWRVGDKTGTGARATTNDVAILWPPGKTPSVIATYLTGATADDAAREQALAEAARIALASLG
jgi:beta-lactamase class A